MSVDVATALFQMVALAVPPIAVLIQMLRKSENLPWVYRKWSFGLAITSVVSFIATGALVAAYLVIHTGPPVLLSAGLVLAILGLVPFSLFTGILYKEHKSEHGP